MNRLEQIFYYRTTTKQEGPFTEEEMIRMIQTGLIDAECEMLILEMENWIKLKDSIYSFYMPKEKQGTVL